MTTIKIEVTAEDIANGERNDCRKCPVARAIERVVPNLKPRVYGKYFLLGYTFPSDIDAPKVATKFINRFDANRPVEPFSFDLELPGHLAADAGGKPA